jgi:hypothetical protein
MFMKVGGELIDKVAKEGGVFCRMERVDGAKNVDGMTDKPLWP